MFAAFLSCAVLAVVAALPTVAGAAGKGTVRGAEAVHVREQPSLDSPSIVTLSKGRVVTVEKVLGPWALVVLDSGRRGYVKAVFLELPPGIAMEEEAPEEPESAAATAAPAPSPPPAATHTWLPEETPTARVAETQSGGGLEREVAQLRERLSALESAVAATPAVAQQAGRLPAEPAEAAPARDREATRAGGAPAPSVAAPIEPDDIGPSLALAGVGLVLGFLIGAAYGRRQERNRRTRVRF